MENHRVDAYYVPSADAHQSEYVTERDKRRTFISGFTGSAGTALVTQEKALLWTDGRYFLQAEMELAPPWELMRQGVVGVPTIEEWLAAAFPRGGSLGIDPFTTSILEYRKLGKTRLPSGAKLEVVSVTQNLIDQIWGSARPPKPLQQILTHPLHFAGETTSSKLKKIREEMDKEGVEVLVVTALDEIAWLFNLRGSDVPFNPLFISYAILTQHSVRLYVESSQLSEAARSELGTEGVLVSPYDSILSDVQDLNQKLLGGNSKKKRVWVDPLKCNVAIYQQIDSSLLFEKRSPLSLLKAVKNQVELKGMQNCHVRDAVAVCNYLYWLEQTLENPDSPEAKSLTEASGAAKLESFRKEQKDFVGPSFETISASGPSGAIIHYRPQEGECRSINKSELYLLDSGGQYRDGTTDITRTVHFGTPSEIECETFTRVLQGHIALSRAIFPKGTVGPALDVVARLPLWSMGLDYAHGTGHGVGAFLSVHEGPQSINSNFKSSALEIPLQPGMVVTNEPGYYHPESFGIRIENVMVVVPSPFNSASSKKEFYSLKYLTLVPFQAKMIRTHLLSPQEVEWINSYHEHVWEKLSPLLSSPVRSWLRKQTLPLSRTNDQQSN